MMKGSALRAQLLIVFNAITRMYAVCVPRDISYYQIAPVRPVTMNAKYAKMISAFIALTVIFPGVHNV